jgi:hypothetical protein
MCLAARLVTLGKLLLSEMLALRLGRVLRRAHDRVYPVWGMPGVGTRDDGAGAARLRASRVDAGRAAPKSQHFLFEGPSLQLLLVALLPEPLVAELLLTEDALVHCPEGRIALVAFRLHLVAFS